MKTTYGILVLLGTSAFVFVGCESDQPPRRTTTTETTTVRSAYGRTMPANTTSTLETTRYQPAEVIETRTVLE